MQEAISRMLEDYRPASADEAVRAMREILQEVALLGLWRARFFIHAAFYGGTALRILHGLDRFSEDLDFTLLEPDPDFDWGPCLGAMAAEMKAFGVDADVSLQPNAAASPIRSAIIRVNMRDLLLLGNAPSAVVASLPPGRLLRVKLEVDTNPPPGFATTMRFIRNPIPFSIRVCDLSDLFAGKMHAVLFRRWRERVKGRDWYDFVWFVARGTPLHLAHLEQRMRSSGDWTGSDALSPDRFLAILRSAIERLDVDLARGEILPYLVHPESVAVWSREFFLDTAGQIQFLRDSQA